MVFLKITKMNKEIICILSLSFCFFLLFCADNAMVNMQKVVVSSIAQERTDYNVEGYTVAGVVYTVFAISLWIGPYLNYALSSKIIMAISALGYLFYVWSYALENAWSIYASAIVTGIAAGILWPAQGHYMISNSSEANSGRNAAIFWLFYMSSTMVGNIFVYISFQGQKYINQSSRRTAIYSLVAINIVAVLAFLALPPSINPVKVTDYGPIRTIKKSWKILTSRLMLLMVLSFFYAGLQQSFCSGIYSPSIGFTLAFGEHSKELVGLSGICMSVGGIIGTLVPIVLADWIRHHSYARRLIVLTGCLAQLCAYLITFLNLPDTAVFGNTYDLGIIKPSIVLALIGSGLLSFGDSCLTTQIYSFLSDYYRENSAEACALYKFVKSMSVAVSFYSSSHLGLHTQTPILALAALIGLVGFCIADHKTATLQQHTEKKDETNGGCEVDSI